jgi:hypothetical protein
MPPQKAPTCLYQEGLIGPCLLLRSKRSNSCLRASSTRILVGTGTSSVVDSFTDSILVVTSAFGWLIVVTDAARAAAAPKILAGSWSSLPPL